MKHVKIIRNYEKSLEMMKGTRKLKRKNRKALEKALKITDIWGLYNFLRYELLSLKKYDDMDINIIEQSWRRIRNGICYNCEKPLEIKLPEIYPENWKLCCVCLSVVTKYINDRFDLTNSCTNYLLPRGSKNPIIHFRPGFIDNFVLENNKGS